MKTRTKCLECGHIGILEDQDLGAHGVCEKCGSLHFRFLNGECIPPTVAKDYVPEMYRVIASALSFLEHRTPIHPGSELHNEMAELFANIAKGRKK